MLLAVFRDAGVIGNHGKCALFVIVEISIYVRCWGFNILQLFIITRVQLLSTRVGHCELRCCVRGSFAEFSVFSIIL